MALKEYRYISKRSGNERDVDIIINSFMLKQTIQKIVSDNVLSVRDICRRLGINGDILLMWMLSSEKAKSATFNITHADIITFCEYIGIDIRITIVVNNKEFKNIDKII